MNSVSAGQTVPPTNPEGPTGALASWVHNVAFDDVPPGIIARAKHLILDIVASGGVLPRLAAQGYLPAEPGDVLRSGAVQMRGAGSGA